MSTITARFRSECPQCHGAINIGDSVEWTRGEKARHTVCPAQPQPFERERGEFFRQRFYPSHASNAGGEWRQMNARFASTCGVCRQPIAEGTAIMYRRGERAVHSACHGQPVQERPVAAPTAPREPLPDVPEGRYAVEVEGTLKFYHVDRPTEGRWAGFTFVRVRASDELHPIRGMAAVRAILNAILAAGVETATVRYGMELGICGVCGRTLTDAESRARGIGPICAAARGYAGVPSASVVAAMTAADRVAAYHDNED